MALRKLPKDVQSLIESSSHINCFSKAIEELVYNSIDAEATSIAVRVNLEDKSIQVIDNGIGITKNDMTKVGKRHMTSKCIDNSTLRNIPKYFGYRGLALAYIIDISENVKITSRHKSTDESLVSEFIKSKRMNVCDIETRPSKGTTIQVKGFLYNLAVQSKKVNAVQEMQEIRQFLEHLSLIRTNLSLSLRDNARNEIIFQTPKCKDIYQKINKIFGIKSTNIKELTVEKDKYKVEAYIGKGINQQNHIIYLNKRYLEYCKVHKTIDTFFAKYLSLQNNVKLTKSKHANFMEELNINNNNIPFYILFLNCPYNGYNLNQMIKKNNLEFNDWTAITNLLEKLVKFYIGNGNLKEIKNNTIRANNKLIDNENIREKVRDIVQKVLKNNTKISQLHNGVKGKITKRIKKKKKDINLSKIISSHKQIVSTQPTKINCLNKFTMQDSSPKTLITNVKNQTAIETTSINTIMEYPEIKNDFDRNLTKHNVPKSKKYKYMKTKTRMDFSLLFNSPLSNSNNICKEVADKINLIMNQFNKTNQFIEGASKSNYSKIRKHKLKKNIYKVTINGCVSFPQTLKQIRELENNINKCLGMPGDKQFSSRADLITTILKTQNNKLKYSNEQNFLKVIPSEGSEICTSLDEKNYKNNPHLNTQDKIPTKYIETNIKENINQCGDSDSIIKDMEMIFKKPKELIKQSSKQYINNTGIINYPINQTNEQNKNLFEEEFQIKNYITTYDSHIYGVNNTKKRHHVKDGNFFINNENFNSNIFISKQKKNHSNNVVKNKRNLVKYSTTNKKVLPTIECSYSIYDSSDNLKDPRLVDSVEDVPLYFSQSNESIRTLLFKNDLPNKNNLKPHRINLDKTINKIGKENRELNNNCGLENNHINKNINVIFISNSQPKQANTILKSEKIHQNTICDMFEDRNENDKSHNTNINCSHGNQYYNIESEKNISTISKKLNPMTPHENESYLNKKESNENNLNRIGIISIDKNNASLESKTAVVDSYNNNENINLNINTEKNLNKHKEGFEYTRYKLINNNLTKNISYLDKETGMIVENNIVEDRNVFDLKDRLRFIPKGLSPIFANCTSTNKTTNILNNCDYFNNTLYKDFKNDVQVGSNIFEAKVQNVEEFTSKEINKVNIRIKKENANIAFDKNSLESIDVLKQVDNKFIAAKMTAKKLNTIFSIEYLVLFDQHAVDERVRLEKNMNDYIIKDNIWKAKTLDSFNLPLSLEEALYLHNYKEKFTQFGLKWTSINDKEISVTAIPEAIFGKHIRNVDVIMNSVKNLIQELVKIIRDQKGSVNLYPRSIMDLVASEACRYAIKFGDALSTTECTKLLDSLQACKVPFQCAHGRPVLAVILEIKSNLPSYRVNPEKLKNFAKKRT